MVNKLFLVLAMMIILAASLVSADIEFFDNLNTTGNVTADHFFGDGSELTGITANVNESDPSWNANLTNGINGDLKPDVDSSRNFGTNLLRWLTGWFDNLVVGEINATSINLNGQAITPDTNRSDADILSVANVYNDTSAINTKLDTIDQRYNETSLINAVNTTANIEGLGFTQGAHTTDTNRTDTEINTLIDNRVVQAFIEALGFVTGSHTVDTNRSDVDILNVASVYNDTVAINTKLDQTDQRYNETGLINSVNTTANIEALNFTQGAHTIDTDTNRTDVEINTLIDNRVIQSFVEALGFVTGAHTIDTNETSRFGNLVDADCSGTDKVIGVQTNGTVLCGSDTDTISNETNLINSVNTTANIEALNFTQGAHTIDTDTNRTDTDINTLIDNRVIQSFIEALGFVTGAHTTDTISNETDLVLSVNTTTNIESLNFTTGPHTTPVGDDGITLNILNITGTDDNACTTGNFVKNVTLANGDIQIICDAPSGSGDITAVTAGTGLIGGGASGDVTLNISSETCSAGEVSKYNGTGFGCVIDSDTSYTNGSGISLVGTQFNHSDTSGQSDSDNSGRTYIQDILLDGFGHITSIVTGTETFTDTISNETDLINSVNTTSNIEGLGFVTGTHTTDTNRTDTEINTLIDNRVIQSFIEALGFVVGSHTVDTNETARFTNLVDVDCGGTDKIIGVQANGTVLCGSDIDIISNETDLVNSVNTTTNIESLGFTQGAHTTDTDTNASTICSGTTTYLDGEGSCDDISSVYEPAGITESDISDLTHVGNNGITLVEANITDLAHIGNNGITLVEANITDLIHTVDTNRTDAQINTLIDNRVIQSFIEALGFVTGAHTTDTQKTTGGQPLYNDSTTIYFNDTFNNATTDARIALNPENFLTSVSDDSVIIKYQNISNLPTCSGTDKLTFDGTTLGCGSDLDTDTQKSAGNQPLYNGSTQIFFNETFNNNTIDNRISLNPESFLTSVADDSVIIKYQNISNLPTCSGTNKLTFDGTILSCGADVDTTYTNGSGISLVGTQFNHSDTSSQADSDNSGRTYIQDILLDSFGHITSIVTATETFVDTTSFFIDTDGEASTEINDGETILFSDSTGMTITRSTNTLTFSTTLGTAIELGEIVDSGALGFDWANDEVADDLTITGGAVDDASLTSNVALLDTVQNFTTNKTFTNNSRTFYGSENQAEIYWDSVNQRLVMKVN